jgi:hypothetical protein
MDKDLAYYGAKENQVFYVALSPKHSASQYDLSPETDSRGYNMHGMQFGAGINFPHAFQL